MSSLLAAKPTALQRNLPQSSSPWTWKMPAGAGGREGRAANYRSHALQVDPTSPILPPLLSMSLRGCPTYLLTLDK